MYVAGALACMRRNVISCREYRERWVDRYGDARMERLDEVVLEKERRRQKNEWLARLAFSGGAVAEIGRACLL